MDPKQLFEIIKQLLPFNPNEVGQQAGTALRAEHEQPNVQNFFRTLMAMAPFAATGEVGGEMPSPLKFLSKEDVTRKATAATRQAKFSDEMFGPMVDRAEKLLSKTSHSTQELEDLIQHLVGLNKNMHSQWNGPNQAKLEPSPTLEKRLESLAEKAHTKLQAAYATQEVEGTMRAQKKAKEREPLASADELQKHADVLLDYGDKVGHQHYSELANARRASGAYKAGTKEFDPMKSTVINTLLQGLKLPPSEF